MNEEKKTPIPQDMDTVRFYSLVTMFASSAYQSMGKIANPMTGKVERNLDGAQGMIDILVMLKKKTAGNLTEDEIKIMESTISDLQLNFVQEKAKPESEPEQKEEEKEEEKEGGEEKEEEKTKNAAPAAESEAKEKSQKSEAGESGPIITPPPPDEEAKKGE